MIHKYSLNGYNIVLDVHSVGGDVVDDVTYDLLDFVDAPVPDACPEQAVKALADKYSLEQITDAFSEI